jgi:hypothetical protein
MPFDGNGNWTSNFNAEADRDAGYKILASRFDNILLADLAQSFENCLTKDTQVKPQQNFNANNYRVINVADPVDGKDAVNKQTMESSISTADATAVHLAGDETITGDKTFSGSVDLGSDATATTPTSATDNSTKVSTTQWFRNALTNLGVQHLTKYEDASGLPYTAPIDGIIRVRIGAVYNWEVYINSIIVQQQSRNDADSCTTTWVTVPVKQGDVVTAGGSIYNVSMYYPY